MSSTDAPATPVTLASPLQLACGVTLKNRIVKSAMSEQLSTLGGDVSPELVELYRRWAAGGIGMTITGNVMVDRRSLGEPRNVVVEDDRDLDGIKRWAEAAKSGGAPAIVQLNHPGRQALASVSSQVVAPSAVKVKIPGAPFATPRALTGDEIEQLIERFATTAGIMVRGGFDGIQLHGAHGYLISQFLSPRVNQRDDQWGGDAEGRRRFVVELARATRAAVGADKVVAVKLNSADFQRGGFSEDESLEVIGALAAEGLDFLEVSGGTYERPAMVGAATRQSGQSESTAAREAYFLEFAERARAVTTMPLMVTGGLRSSRAMRDALDHGIDIVGVARPVCLEPELPTRLIDDETSASRLQPIRTGVRKLDAPADLWWSNIQIHRLAAGKQPRPRLTGWETLGHILVRDGINGLRRKRS
jgi:2,4-dienoyl-CoA reductase-like NADH-dependent reductase (Old Yellow Enzyme family)